MDKENKVTFLLFLKYLLNLTDGVKKWKKIQTVLHAACLD